MNLGFGHYTQSEIPAIQTIGDGAHTGQRLFSPTFFHKRLVYSLGRYVGIQQDSAQARFRFAVWLHDALYFSQRFGVLVFCFWPASGGDVIDAGDACLALTNTQFNGSSIAAKYIPGHPPLAIKQRHRYITHRAAPCGSRLGLSKILTRQQKSRSSYCVSLCF